MLVFLFLLLLPSAFAKLHCNGHAELCPRRYSNISQIGSHDSAFVGMLPSDNQDLSVTDQLNKGVRFLQVQTHHDLFGRLSLCHTSCFLLDAGTLQSYLTTVKKWLDQNTNEIVTLLLTNDGGDVQGFERVFVKSGIKKYAFSPPKGMKNWPTLQDMIAKGTRLVTFLGRCSFNVDAYADTSRLRRIAKSTLYT